MQREGTLLSLDENLSWLSEVCFNVITGNNTSTTSPFNNIFIRGKISFDSVSC